MTEGMVRDPGSFRRRGGLRGTHMDRKTGPKGRMKGCGFREVCPGAGGRNAARRARRFP